MKLIWVSPRSCIPPHAVSHPDKVVYLANVFAAGGWGDGEEALIGYPWKNKIQLLSGSHRLIAAKLARLKLIPVLLHKRKSVEEAFGDLDKWYEIMKGQ